MSQQMKGKKGVSIDHRRKNWKKGTKNNEQKETVPRKERPKEKAGRNDQKKQKRNEEETKKKRRRNEEETKTQTRNKRCVHPRPRLRFDSTDFEISM